MPQPTSKPGQPGGDHGPTRPIYLPFDFSSTANIPKPCSAQCPDITAALRQPESSLVIGLPSAAMKRAVPGSDSIAVFAATSALRPFRTIRRSVSTPGPSPAITPAPYLT